MSNREPTTAEWACSRVIRQSLQELNRPPNNPGLGLTGQQVHIVVNVALGAFLFCVV